jgi:hypothetical protein
VSVDAREIIRSLVDARYSGLVEFELFRNPRRIDTAKGPNHKDSYHQVLSHFGYVPGSAKGAQTSQRSFYGRDYGKHQVYLYHDDNGNVTHWQYKGHKSILTKDSDLLHKGGSYRDLESHLYEVHG